jgi:hypothetical protein
MTKQTGEWVPSALLMISSGCRLHPSEKLSKSTQL